MSVSISSNGNIIAISAPTNTPTSQVYIYEWSGNDWILKGNSILGGNANEQFGYSVSINNDGTIVAIGTYPVTYTGTVRIYEWDGNDWILKGSQLEGLTTDEYFGKCVSINSNGTVVAIGSERHTDVSLNECGKTSIYEWSGSEWTLKGNSIIGLSADEKSGSSVSIDNDALLLLLEHPNIIHP